MVMSMDSVSDQTMSSPIDDSAISPSMRQQESLDDEQNEDEQSKGSGQTVVVKQQQPQSQMLAPSHQAQQVEDKVSDDINDELGGDEQQSSAMVVSRGSSIDEERKLMMNVDYVEEETCPASTQLGQQQQHQQEQHRQEAIEPDKTSKLPEISRRIDPRQDSLVARMRDIVQGGQCESEQQSQQQPKSSSDSLNNQNENNSKASVDSGQQQKRSKHTRVHCSRHHHHHHHHHHRPSVSGASGSVVAGGGSQSGNGNQPNPVPPHHHHHHHHHHHRRSAGQRQHSHHHHHHHSHQQTTGAKTANEQSCRRNSVQRPLQVVDSATKFDIPEEDKQQQQEQAQQQTNESKSSTSSVSSAAQHQDQSNLQKASEITDSKPSVEASVSEEQYLHHLHHHHHIHNQEERERQHHLHHLHHHHHHALHQSEGHTRAHHHHHHCHHRSHKKRMVLDSSNDQPTAVPKTETPEEQADGSSSSSMFATNQGLDTDQQHDSAQQLDLSKMNDANKQGPLQDITSQSNLRTTPYCPHHEQCPRSSRHQHQHSHTHAHPHHHHHPHHHPHHHHHQHHPHLHQHQLQTCKDAPLNEQQQPSASNTKGHHHHHHHHHRHHRHNHHHHHHHGKQRHKNKQKSSSKTNIEEQQHGLDFENAMDKSDIIQQQPQQLKQSTDLINDDQSNVANTEQYVQQTGSMICDSSIRRGSTSARVVKGERMIRGVHGTSEGYGDDGIESDYRMHLDQEDMGNSGKSSGQQSSHSVVISSRVTNETADNEVVKMEMSPNSEVKSVRMADDCEQLIDSTASDSNLITSIEIIPTTRPNSILTSNRKSIQEDKIDNNRQQPDSEGKRTSTPKLKIGVDKLETTKRDSIHDFSSSNNNRGQQQQHQQHTEKFSIKEDNLNEHDRLVRQISSQEESKKPLDEGGISGSGGSATSGNNSKQDRNWVELSAAPIETYRQSSQPKQIIETSVPPDRRCRLCWCCCCPCSALSNRGSSNRTETTKQTSDPSNNSPANKCPTLPNVPLDEIRAWGDSFDRLMKCSDGRKIFQDFLRCEYSEENILFWIACEELKAERDSKNIATKARDIYEDYISILSAKEVSLDSRVRDIINTNIKKPTSNIFDEAQLQIYTLMHRDSYPRFINSAMYKKLAQLQPSSRKSSS